jgi:hypothetical protein
MANKAAPKTTTDPATKLMKAAEALVNPDPNAIKLAYDPKAPRPFLLACATCQKPIRPPITRSAIPALRVTRPPLALRGSRRQRSPLTACR